MSKEEILNLFYEEIIPSASRGRIDCYFFYNIVFNTRIEDSYVKGVNYFDDVIVPTLNISDKDKFDDLLVTYVNKAVKFYGDDSFSMDAIDSGISKEKIVLALIWGNATYEDFNDPCNYLRKRINFFEVPSISDDIFSKRVIGNSHILLDSDVVCEVNKNKLGSETPYSIHIYFTKEIDGKIYKFFLPRVYFGISDDIVYLYAVQKDKKDNIENSSYQKKINRILYKVNEGFDSKSDNDFNYGVGNLKDVTPSFLVTLNIVLGMLRQNGYFKINVISILPERWNSKRIANEIYDMAGVVREGLSQVEIQKNLTEKYIRSFLRLSYHHSGILVLDYLEESSSLLLYLSLDDECNNSLLEETYSLENSNLIKKVR